jgi:hypothetical protein
MRGEDMRGAMLARGLRQQPISRGAGRSGQSSPWLVAGPAQGLVRQIERLRQPLDVAGFARSLHAQAVIDGDGDQPRTARERAAPACHKPHQRDRIRAAGNREHDRGRGLPVREQIFRVLCRNREMIVVRHIGAVEARAQPAPSRQL